ncbi:MAG: nuclear transport factor 2 family protein [Proteobacteria bacterium]|nr:nuclear transport factor 2 family protein [Pseudomonadota bacterium]
MSQTRAAIAQAFYTAMSEKNVKAMEKYLHPDIQFIAPLAKVKGKENYFQALKNFTSFFETLTIRATFGEGDKAMVVYDVDCPAPVGKCPTAALMTFHNELITKIELFYDGRPFEKKEG